MNSRRKTAAGASPAASAAASTVEVPIDGYATSSFEVLPAPVMFDPAHIPALTPLAEVRASDVAVAMPIDGILQARRDLEGLDPEAQARAGVRVVGPRLGRRRAGRAFGPDPVDIAVLDLTEDELRAIDADPLLSLSLVQLLADDDETEG